MRRFVHAAAKWADAKEYLKSIEFVKARGYEMSGYAWPDSGVIEIRLPKGLDPEKDRTELAQLLVHELDHLAGDEHPDMQLHWEQKFSWHETLPLRLRKDAKIDPERYVYEKLIRQCTLAMYGFPEAAPWVAQILDC